MYIKLATTRAELRMTITTKAATLLTICVLSSVAPHVVGWGQRVQLMRGGGFGIQRATTLAASESGDDAHDELSEYRQRLERSFAVFDGDADDPIGAFISSSTSGSASDDDDETDINALDRIYSVNAMDVDEDFLCDGDLCDLGDDECMIPDAFKIVPGENNLDVMSFLGIRRVLPLQPKSTNAGDWQ